ncbi:MAG TPA: UPF0182 family protein [Actinomycetota bacterium]|nr:UPF0182 family protein [Actinomycetota bacterium]
MASTTVRIPYARRRWPIVVISVLVATFLLLTFLSNFYVDVLWYREVALSEVFWTRIWAQAGLAAAFFVTFFVLLMTNLYVTRRLAPRVVALTPEQEIVERFRENAEPYLRWAVPLGAAVLSVFVGLAAAGHWQEFLLWRSSDGITFGDPELVFRRDPAFYVFSLPWLKYLQGWLFAALVGVTVIVSVGHFVQGGIRPQAVGLREKVDPQVRAHLSVLLGFVLLAKAWGYYLGRFDLLTSQRGVVQGASYTDVNAQLPALTFLAIVAVICAILFFVNARYRVWSLPIIAVGLLLLVSILLGTAYPAFIQQFRVSPNEQQYEVRFIERNIAGTQRAFALDEIQVEERPFVPRVTADAVEANETTISNIRLWRPVVLQEVFESVQRIRQYFDFTDVDVDRYEIDGERRILMISGREVTQQGITGSGRTWQNQHLVYTHGFGAAAAQVNSITPDGAPVLTLEDIPPAGEPETEQPRIYYGEREDVPFVVVNSETAELDFSGETEVPFTYTGSGGIELGGWLRQAVFAWRFRDINLLISAQIDADSRILMRRRLETRVAEPLPFLTFDDDPYLAVTSEGYVWIWDAYTTSDGYPYSQSLDLAEATANLQDPLSVNYMRNSVKAVVNAYDGTLTYYADLDEPIMQAWSRAFPGVFSPIEEAPDELREHFRYPENLFQAQAFHFANYHVEDADAFYRKQDFWEIPADPTVANAIGPDGSPIPTSGGRRLLPHYLLMRLPDETEERFHLVVPFQPEERLNMVAWLAANSDPDGYGELVAFTFPAGRDVDGPGLAFSRINSDQEFSSARTLLGQQGSQILFGDLLTIPIEDSILYVLPMYTRAAQEAAVPELKLVTVVNGSVVSVGTSLADALEDATGATTDGDGQPPPDGGEGTVDEQVARLLTQATEHFAAAQEALRGGDLAAYQSELEEAQALVEQANELLGGQGDAPVPSPSP